jgi:hypothetical protein
MISMLIVSHSRRSVAVPLSTMTKAEAVDDGWIVTDAQGEEHRFDKISWDIAVETAPTATLSALPGTYLINPCEEEDGRVTVWKQNVLGWAICFDGETRPVTLNPEASLSGPWQILHPDGRVERSDGSTWESLNLWLDEDARIREKLRSQKQDA